MAKEQKAPKTAGAPPELPTKGTNDMPANATKYDRTLAALKAQPTVSVMLERREGEFPELEFNINGVRYVIVRGIPCEVPQQVAQMLYERMAAENKVAQMSKDMVANLEKGRIV